MEKSKSSKIKICGFQHFLDTNDLKWWKLVLHKKWQHMIHWIFRFFFFHEIPLFQELRQKIWDISGCGCWILDQRPDLERLLNSAIEFGTVKFGLKTNYLSKMSPKLTKGENIFFFIQMCRQKMQTHPNINVSRQNMKSFF